MAKDLGAYKVAGIIFAIAFAGGSAGLVMSRVRGKPPQDQFVTTPKEDISFSHPAKFPEDARTIRVALSPSSELAGTELCFSLDGFTPTGGISADSPAFGRLDLSSASGRSTADCALLAEVPVSGDAPPLTLTLKWTTRADAHIGTYVGQLTATLQGPPKKQYRIRLVTVSIEAPDATPTGTPKPASPAATPTP